MFNGGRTMFNSGSTIGGTNINFTLLVVLVVNVATASGLAWRLGGLLVACWQVC